MRRVVPILMGLGLSGCFNYEAFQIQSAGEYCEWFDRCDVMIEDSVGECVDEATEDLEANAACENFNADAARACLEEIGELDCGVDLFFDLGDLEVCAGVCTN